MNRSARDTGGEDGAIGLVGLLLTLLVLGAAVAISLAALGTGSSPPRTHNPLLVPTSTTAGTAGGSVGESAVESCNVDAKIVESALNAYSAVNNGQYPLGLSVLATSTSGGPYLHSVPSSKSFTITTDGKGDVFVALARNEEGSEGAYAVNPGTHPENYDTFKYGAGPLRGRQICAGATTPA